MDGFPVVMSDTAGIRRSEDEIEKKGIKLALKKAKDADLNIIVFEPNREPPTFSIIIFSISL